MKTIQYVQSLYLVGVLSLLGTPSIQAKEAGSVQPNATMPRLRNLKCPAMTVKEWLAQVEALTVQVIRVNVERTNTTDQFSLDRLLGKFSARYHNFARSSDSIGRLRSGGIVASDNIVTFKKELKPYVEFLQSPANGYRSSTLALKGGTAFSVEER